MTKTLNKYFNYCSLKTVVQFKTVIKMIGKQAGWGR